MLPPPLFRLPSVVNRVIASKVPPRYSYLGICGGAAEMLLHERGNPRFSCKLTTAWASLTHWNLRKWLVSAVVSGGLSCNQAAEQFGVAVSTAIGWVRRQRETGSVAPGKMGGHRPKAISGEHRVWVLERTKRDFTLRGLVAELAERGLKVDYRSVWEFVHAENLSFKKSVVAG